MAAKMKEMPQRLSASCLPMFPAMPMGHVMSFSRRKARRYTPSTRARWYDIESIASVSVRSSAPTGPVSFLP